MPERINVIRLKCAYQKFELEYKPKKDDYKRATQIRREARMARIEGRKLEEEELIILLLQASFPRSIKVISSGITDLHISTLEC